MKSNLSWDIPASIVVFLVALPLCLGIALASGAPPIAGLIAGVIGGLIVGSLSGSSLGVSGPAAGLAVIVYEGIESMPSFEVFALAVVVGGVVQLLLCLARAGVLALFVPTSVVSGMLAAIGIIICFKQLPHAVGYDEEYEGSLQFVTDSSHNTISNLLHMFESFQPTATLISVVGLGLLLLWETKFIKSQKWSHLVPAPLLVVILGVLVYNFTKGGQWELSPEHLVQIPLLTDGQGLSTFFTFPDFSAILRMDVWKLGVTLAIVASIETLLCVDATDKLDPQHRQTPTNRELFAQGTGNICSGLVGGLPITQVIVRSSANIQSNAKSKLSAILHGVWLIVTILAIPSILNMIPLASLAAILLVVGYKLAKPATFMKMAKKGHHQFFPFIVTVLAIVFTDLLIGIGIGLTVALIYILWNHFSRPTDRVEKDDENKTYTIHLCSDVTFLHRLGISKTIADVPDDYHIYVDTQNTNSIDPDVQEVLVDLQSKAASKGRKFEILTKQTSD